jgi:hypothetical protein
VRGTRDSRGDQDRGGDGHDAKPRKKPDLKTRTSGQNERNDLLGGAAKPNVVGRDRSARNRARDRQTHGRERLLLPDERQMPFMNRRVPVN